MVTRRKRVQKPIAPEQNGQLPRGQWKSSEGVILHLRGIPPLFLERLSSDESGKPSVPEVEVTYLGGKKGKEQNPNNPEYLEAVKTWKGKREMAMIMTIIGRGVADNPPEDFVIEMKEMFPSYTQGQMKYLWVTTLLLEPNDVLDLISAIMSLTMATEDEVESAMDKFRREDQRSGRKKVQNNGNIVLSPSVETPGAG